MKKLITNHPIVMVSLLGIVTTCGIAAVRCANEQAAWRRTITTIEEHGGMVCVREDVQPSRNFCLQERPMVAGVSFGGSESFSPRVFAALHQMPRIGRLDLEDVAFDKDLSRLASLETLEELHLSFSKVTDQGLINLRDLPGLRRIYLTDCEITGETFDVLALACPNIDTLFLARTKLTPEGVAKLRHFQRLRCLDLSDCEIEGNVVPLLADITTLERLYLYGQHVNEDDCRLLQQLPNLRSLELTGTGVSTDGLRAIAEITTLEELGISASAVTAEFLDDLQALNNLRDLQISIGPPYILNFATMSSSDPSRDHLIQVESDSEFEGLWIMKSRMQACREALTRLVSTNPRLRLDVNMLRAPWRNRQWFGQRLVGLLAAGETTYSLDEPEELSHEEALEGFLGPDYQSPVEEEGRNEPVDESSAEFDNLMELVRANVRNWDRDANDEAVDAPDGAAPGDGPVAERSSKPVKSSRGRMPVEAMRP